jgi:hypothetical protein
MARRAYEKTQNGNPHQLPVKQHVFPARSIARFANSAGMVQLHNLTTQRTRAARPGDAMFCAMRAWDLRAERGYMKQIEDVSGSGRADNSRPRYHDRRHRQGEGRSLFRVVEMARAF